MVVMLENLVAWENQTTATLAMDYMEMETHVFYDAERCSLVLNRG